MRPALVLALIAALAAPPAQAARSAGKVRARADAVRAKVRGLRYAVLAARVVP